MLFNLTPRNDFKTKAEREAKWRNRHIHAHDEKKFPYKFNELFKATNHNGIYYSDYLGFRCINESCKQRTFIDSAKYWKTRPSARFRRLFPAEFANHENNIEFHGIADNLDQIVEFYNNGYFFAGNHVVLCRNIELHQNELNLPNFGLINTCNQTVKYIGNKKLCSVDADGISEIEFMIYKIV